MTIFVDPDVPAGPLRQMLYEGDLVILTGLPAVAELIAFARDQLAELFAPHDPEFAHEHYTKAEAARILGEWKPRFIHSDRAKRLVCDVVRQATFSPHDTHYDVPKPRTAFPVGHLTTGIAYAFPWHRDVWYSAPAQQINWWLPVFPVRQDNSMSFDLPAFGRVIPNSSHAFDYYRNNAARLHTASQITKEEQVRPAALGHMPTHDLAVLPAPGQILLFSGAHLHRSIPNTSARTRYSIDFRTVDVRDLEARRGAPINDVYCTGTAIRDFHRVADGRAIEEETVVRLFGAPPRGSMLVFPAADTDLAARR